MLPIDDEIRELANFYSIPFPSIEEQAKKLTPFLGNYCELALDENSFGVITEGSGEDTAGRFAELAYEGNLCAESVELFLACEKKFSGRHLGFKQAFGGEAKGPSLYVRFKSPKREVLDFLRERIPQIGEELEAHLKDNEIFYGLGFFGSGQRRGVKTYVLRSLSPSWCASQDPVRGFLSHRWIEGQLSRERVEYIPNFPLDRLKDLGGNWPKVFNRVRSLFKVDRLDHLGVVSDNGHASRYKIYLERIGSIPTDFSAV